ncbi:hypothetical protein SSX86_025610 [Deinandra increscens subsp. villosa]|uniref:Uncharacterized protein n=1 Tax=Deinandra increscens subsp. villosa TaxID=3103831 RepID=A0AAP0CIV7_9ASTR
MDPTPQERSEIWQQHYQVHNQHHPTSSTCNTTTAHNKRPKTRSSSTKRELTFPAEDRNSGNNHKEAQGKIRRIGRQFPHEAAKS